MTRDAATELNQGKHHKDESMPIVKKLVRVIGVADMAAAKRFYVAALNLVVLSQSESWIELSCGNGSLALSPSGADRASGADGVERTKVIFEVEGLDQLVAHIEALGGKVVHVTDRPGSPVRVVHMLDPYQNVFQLSERRR